MGRRNPLSWLASRRRIERDVDDEILGHIELKARELERSGVPLSEARARAEAAFGRADAVRDACRDIQMQIVRRRGRMMRIDELVADVRWALRSLARAPGFATFAVVTLALGIAAVTSILSVASGLFSPPPGVRDPKTLVEIYQTPGFVSVSYPLYESFRDAAPELRGLAAYDVVGLSLDAGNGRPDVVMGLQVSGNYFDVLGTRAALGRFFQGEEREVGQGPAVAVLSDGLWRERFASDPAVVGSSIRLNGVSVTVIGVAEAGFSGNMGPVRAQVFMPLGSPLPGFHEPRSLERVENSMLELIGRVERGTNASVLAARLDDLARRRLDAAGLDSERYRVAVRAWSPMGGAMRGPTAAFLVILSVLVGVLLLIACLNVAGLLLSRSIRRRGEIAVRVSLGATQGRLLRQLLVEAVTLALVAGTLGILLTWWITGALSALQLPVSPIPGLELDLHLRPDPPVLLLSLAVVLGTGLVFGLVPALRATRVDLVSDLKQGRRSVTLGRGRMQGLLVGAQMAGTIVLLAGSGLFLRALVSARSVDPGFDATDVYVASFDLELAGRSDADSWSFYSELERRAAALPGVTHATVAAKLPLAGLSQIAPVRFEDVEPPPGQTGFTLANQTVGPDYFAALGIRVLQGRGIVDSDDASAPHVVVVNRFLADRMWPGTSALGRTIALPAADSLESYTVVGVAATTAIRRIGEEPRMFAYFSAAQRPRTDMVLHVKMAPGQPPPFRAIRDLAAELEPAAATLSTGSLAAAVSIFLLPQRIGAWVTGVVGLFGLLLGCIGIYALTAFRVAGSSREIGIRMALGAKRGEVVSEVLRRGLAAPVAGGLIGLAAALLGARFLRAFLFGVQPLDPVTFLGVVVMLAAASLAANLLPAIRAARTDPVRVLKQE